MTLKLFRDLRATIPDNFSKNRDFFFGPKNFILGGQNDPKTRFSQEGPHKKAKTWRDNKNGFPGLIKHTETNFQNSTIFAKDLIEFFWETNQSNDQKSAHSRQFDHTTRPKIVTRQQKQFFWFDKHKFKISGTTLLSC